ncbi:unnamed protein product [Cuscuta campestris]|uniref:Filament-like plant protein n=1 Tax=Cuscuta campestris TaxID=132261 RepID=A0A484KN92_9ASTE|nr:unnamed protein product [Cuscuta campestris]
MERRSWLWRKKSSDKIPSGETESSGSISSHSERFSDDQAIPNHSNQSPEVTSKTASNNEDHDESMKSISAKLSEALLNIRAKEDLVKQHAKVAEDAVSGWEKAEAEVLTLKQQVEAATEKNSALEERASQLDGALKECLRQLRHSREEQEQKILEAISDASSQWESRKSELEKQLAELQSELQAARFEALGATDLRAQLEFMIKERDLSTLAAETASKQHLESTRKVSKLEGECRMLKAALAHKAQSFADTQSDQFRIKKSPSGNRLPRSSSSDIKNLMDDFLEMEKLAASHEPDNEVDEKLENIEAEKRKLEMELKQCQSHLKTSSKQLKDAETKVMELRAELALVNGTFKENLQKMEVDMAELQATLDMARKGRKSVEAELDDTKLKLKKSMERLEETEANLLELRTQLERESEIRHGVEFELKDCNGKREELESGLKAAEHEVQNLRARVSSLEEEVKKEKRFSQEAIVKLRKIESLRLRPARNIGDCKLNKEEELAAAANRFEECRKTIASIGKQLETLSSFEDLMINS